MKKFKLSENINSNKVFIINRLELGGRLDPHFHKKEYNIIKEKLSLIPTSSIRNESVKIFSGITPLSGGDAYTDKDNGIPFVRSGDFSEDNIIDFNNLNFIKPEIHNKLMKGSKILRNDLLIAIVVATIGKVGVYNYDFEANINQAICGVRFKENINPHFIHIFFLTDLGQKILDRIKRPVARANINLEEVGSIPIPLLDIITQKKIVSYFYNKIIQKQQKEAEAQRLLDSIDDYLLGELGITLPKEEEFLPQNTDKNSNYNLDNDNPLVKKGRLFLTNLSEVTGKRIDPDYYSIYYKKIMTKVEKGKYPMDTISNNCINVFSGKTPSSSEYSKDNTLYPIIKVSSYTDYKIDVEKAAFSVNKQPFSILKGDMFILSAAHQAEYVGKHIKYLEETPECSTSFVGELLCIRVNEEKLLSNYLFPLLNTKYYKILINREKTGQTSHIYPKDVESIKIPLPPLQKQNEIAAHISQIRNKANALKQEGKEILEQAKQEVEQMILGN